MATVHWLGAGLSSVPGIRRLAASGQPLVLWNRTLDKAKSALGGLNGTATARQLDWNELGSVVSAGDVVVSMLPAPMHPQVAGVCLDRGSHFVSSSYISPAMQDLTSAASDAGLCFVNEVGLDPGLDHLLAHELMSCYRESESFAQTNGHYFRSYCGGFPKVPNDFRYKFSWSPLGVLNALKSPAKWIDNGEVQTTNSPWKSIQDYKARLPHGEEVFEAYPNRDSIPFMQEYGFDPDWNMQTFVRGTLRLAGWSQAWAEIFELVENAAGEEGHQKLVAKSEQLWEQYRYETSESDRVVLSVDLQVNDDAGQTVWHQVYCLDECGHEAGSAMARLVSLTSSIAVESVLAGHIKPGVSAAPRKMELVGNWLDQMRGLGEKIERIQIV